MKAKRKGNRSIMKRFKLTANGHIKRARGGGSHYNTKKAKDRKRRLRKKTLVPVELEKKMKEIISASV